MDILEEEQTGRYMEKCPSCGRLHERGEKVCSKCGAHVLSEQSDFEIVGSDFDKIGGNYA